MPTDRTPSIRRATPWLVLGAAAVLLLIRADAAPLLDPDESRFARTSVEMLESGDLVVPRFGGEPRLVKPPLVHWIQVFLFSWLGISAWTARLHAALATLGSIAMVGWIARRRFGAEAAVWATAVLATMPLVFVPGRIGTLDALLAVHVLAIIALDLAAPEVGGRYRGLALGGLLGLAFLVKGPVGVLLPLLVILAGRTASRRELLPSWRTVLEAAAAGLAVVLPWGATFLQRVGGGTATGLLRTEVLERYFASPVHAEPPWFYAQVAMVGFLPWSAPLVVALVRAWRLRRDPVALTAVYAASGLLAGFVFFSLSQGKLASYVLPLAPLAAVLVTWELGREIESRDRIGSTLLAVTLVASAALLGLAGGLRLQDEPRVVAFVGAVFYGLGGMVALHAARHGRPRGAYGAAAAAAGAFLLVVATVLLPAVGRTKSAAPLVVAVPALSSQRPVVTVEIKVPSLTFYLGRHPEVIEMARLGERLSRADRALFVVADVDVGDIPPSLASRLREVGRNGKFLVLEEIPDDPENAGER